MLGPGGDEELADQRRHRSGRLADVRRIDRHVAPRDHELPLLDDRVREQRLELGPARLVVRQEAHRDAVAPERRQLRVEHSAEESVGELDQDPRAVARQAVGARRTAMLEIRERGQRALDRLVRRLRVQVRDEGDAAGIVLVGSVVETAPCHWTLPPLG